MDQKDHTQKWHRNRCEKARKRQKSTWSWKKLAKIFLSLSIYAPVWTKRAFTACAHRCDAKYSFLQEMKAHGVSYNGLTTMRAVSQCLAHWFSFHSIRSLLKFVKGHTLRWGFIIWLICAHLSLWQMHMCINPQLVYSVMNSFSLLLIKNVGGCRKATTRFLPYSEAVLWVVVFEKILASSTWACTLLILLQFLLVH